MAKRNPIGRKAINVLKPVRNGAKSLRKSIYIEKNLTQEKVSEYIAILNQATQNLAAILPEFNKVKGDSCEEKSPDVV